MLLHRLLPKSQGQGEVQVHALISLGPFFAPIVVGQVSVGQWSRVPTGPFRGRYERTNLSKREMNESAICRRAITLSMTTRRE